MTTIGLISDTHDFLDEKVFEHFRQCDEIWHAGDAGIGVLEKLEAFKSLRAVWGNIDDLSVRNRYPEQIVFNCEDVKVLIRHIGGSPPNYDLVTRKALGVHQPQLFVCGHSHILKVMYDKKFNCLYLNPGAAGKQGWHKSRTIMRFAINGKEIKNCEVIELGSR